jgi:hypothetical protein
MPALPWALAPFCPLERAEGSRWDFPVDGDLTIDSHQRDSFALGDYRFPSGLTRLTLGSERPEKARDVLRALIGQTDPLTERAQTWIASE